MSELNESENRARRVLIVDDQPIVRQGLGLLIDQEDDLKVCGEAADARAARAALQQTQPNVVILDFSLGASDGIDLVRDIRSEYEQLPILVFSVHDENIYAKRLLSVGANGYIMKQASADQLLTALRRVLAGGFYVSEHVGTSIIERLAAGRHKQTGDLIEGLSNRELEVLDLIGRGKTARQVAESLNVSLKTVDSHRQNIKKKLGLENSAQLAQFATHRLLIYAKL